MLYITLRLNDQVIHLLSAIQSPQNKQRDLTLTAVVYTLHIKSQGANILLLIEKFRSITFRNPATARDAEKLTVFSLYA